MEKRSNFEPNAFYHLYNHANGDEDLFRTEDNYEYFLKKYQQYLSPVAKTYAYCLMPNHFHFLIQVKPLEDLIAFYNLKYGENICLSDIEDSWDENAISKIISQQLSNMFNGYTQALNKEQNREGNLFRRAIRRKKVEDEIYRNNLVVYIHRNPIHHCFVADFGEWAPSSYRGFFSEKPVINVEFTEVIEWFGNQFAFEKKHQDELKNFSLQGFDVE